MGKKSRSKQHGGKKSQSSGAVPQAIARRFVKSLPPKELVSMIGSRRVLPSDDFLKYTAMSGHADAIFRQGLVDEGLIPTVLGLLNHCEDESYSSEANDFGPYCWLGALETAMAPNFLPIKDERIRLEIASGIGPVVKAMCNDIKQEFFQSKKLWYLSMIPFLDLIRVLMLHTKTEERYEREATEILLQHSGLMELIVQCMFWGSHRGDISRGFSEHTKTGSINAIEKIAKGIFDNISIALDDGVKGTGVAFFRGDGKDLVNRIALTPIVNPRYDTQCNVEFVIGLMDLIETRDFTKSTQMDNSWYFDHIGAIVIAGCVDNDVIKRVINLGPYMKDCDSAVGLIKVCFDMLCPRTGGFTPGVGHQVKESETRFAAAMSHGLIEMCLELLSRFSKVIFNEELMDQITNLVDSAKIVSLNEKCARAIASRRLQIKEKLVTLEPIISNGRACTKSLKIIKGIVSYVPDGTGKESCLACGKVLEKDAVKRCAKCKVGVYCSKSCQVNHWTTGDHAIACKSYAANAKKIKASGGKTKDMRNEFAQFNNVKEAGRELVTKKLRQVIFQAMLKGYDIDDCVIWGNLYGSTNTVDVMLASDFLNKHGKQLPEAEALIGQYKKQETLVCAYQSSTMLTLAGLDKPPFWSSLINEMERVHRTETLKKMSSLFEEMETPDLAWSMIDAMFTALDLAGK